MRWLWFAGPAVALLVFLFTGLWRSPRQQRRLRELERWLDEYLGPLPIRRKAREKPMGYRKVQARDRGKSRKLGLLPAAFRKHAEAPGGGSTVANIVLRPKLAYVTLRESNVVNGSDYQTVIAQLGRPGPSFTVRPLPEVDGQPIDNTGIQFRKDPAFMEYFLVEAERPGQAAKDIGKWLDADLRDALLEMPNAWLRVEGNMMAVTVYGDLDADQLDELLGLADTLYGTHGKRRKGGGVVSLFPDGDPLEHRKKTKAPKPKEASGHRRAVAGAIDLGLYGAATFLAAMALGHFAWFHSDVFFNNPQMIVREPWQGGWTTKGFGFMVMAEVLLVGLFAAQSWLTTERGQSIGKALVGLQVVRRDGDALDWVSGLLKRTWIYALIPLAVAIARATPIVPRTIFRNLATLPGAISIAVAVAVAAAPLLMGQPPLHDRVSGTMVVDVPRLRFDARQSKLLMVSGGLVVAIGLLATAFYMSGLGILLFLL